MLSTLWDFYYHELPDTFRFPATQLAPDDLWELTEHTPFVTNRKMSRSRFLEYFRGALMTGTEAEQAQTATYNRLRRFLPTLANTMQLGSWKFRKADVTRSAGKTRQWIPALSFLLVSLRESRS